MTVLVTDKKQPTLLVGEKHPILTIAIKAGMSFTMGERQTTLVLGVKEEVS